MSSVVSESDSTRRMIFACVAGGSLPLMGFVQPPYSLTYSSRALVKALEFVPLPFDSCLGDFGATRRGADDTPNAGTEVGRHVSVERQSGLPRELAV